MQRNTLIIFLSISTILGIIVSYLTTIKAEPGHFDRHELKMAILRKWYSQHRTFIPASDQGIEVRLYDSPITNLHINVL